MAENLDEARRNFEESRTLYELLQDQVIPSYYRRGEMGHSPEWIRMAKRSIATILPRFSASRMVNEYLSKFYLPATRQGRRYSQSDFEVARRLAVWKQKVRETWPKVAMRRLDSAPGRVAFGGGLRLEVGVQLGGLDPRDVTLELLLNRQPGSHAPAEPVSYAFESEGLRTEQGEHRFALDLNPQICGKLEYRIRLFPRHELLTNPFELGMMRWL